MSEVSESAWSLKTKNSSIRDKVSFETYKKS